MKHLQSLSLHVPHIFVHGLPAFYTRPVIVCCGMSTDECVYALNSVLLNPGHPFSVAHLSRSSWPLTVVAQQQVNSSHGHSCSRAHICTSRCPPQLPPTLPLVLRAVVLRHPPQHLQVPAPSGECTAVQIQVLDILAPRAPVASGRHKRRVLLIPRAVVPPRQHQHVQTPALSGFRRDVTAPHNI